MMNKKRVFITGGHLTPAVATIDELLKKGWQIYYLGRVNALEGDSALSQEYQLLSARSDITFLPVVTGRLQRSFTKYSLLSLLKIPVGLLQSIFYLITHQPDCILSFGGYVAVPVVVCGWLMRKKIITHEQTMTSGLSNSIISHCADKICVSWPEVINHFPKDKVVLTGNPIRQEIFRVQKIINLPHDKPILYITGGNLGSHAINEFIGSVLEELLDSYTVIHQCGNSKTYNDFAELNNLRAKLSEEKQNRYFLFEYISSNLLASVFSQSDVIVSRAGANSVTEIIFLTKPTLFIPLPWSGNNEQQKQAEFLKNKNAAELLLQSDLNPEHFFALISQLLTHAGKYSQQLSQIKAQLPSNAAQHLATLVDDLYNKGDA